MIESGYIGMVFNIFLHFPDLWVYISERIHLLVSSCDISGFMGMIFRKFSRLMGTLEKFLRIYGWYFYDLNGTIPYLGNASNPPPQDESRLCRLFTLCRLGGANLTFARTTYSKNPHLTLKAK